MRFVPLFISWIIISAHFYRQGAIELALICLGIPFAIFTRKTIIYKGIQWMTFALVVVWMNTGVGLVSHRLSMGMDYFRLIVIIIGVLIFTLWSGWLLFDKQIDNS